MPANTDSTENSPGRFPHTSWSMVLEAQEADPAALSRTPDRTVLDLRAVFSQFAIGPGKASLSIWGKNVLNDKSANYFIPFGPAFLNLVTANYNDPRTYGVTLGLRY